MDIITYALSKKIAAHALSGVQSMSVSGQTLTINTKDSGVLTMTFPTPKDGVSVTDIDVNANNQIVFTMSDGSEFISGKIPTVKGDKGDPGFSPTITENAGNTDKIYKLDITTADSTFTTPNLKGADGQGGTGGGEENIIDSISVNGINVTPDENKNVDIIVPTVTNDLTDELKSSYDEAVAAKHTHDNKTVLDGITAEKVESWDKAEENVQSDWNETDDTADGFIKNKPIIPDITGLATETYVDNKVADYTKTADLADVATSGSYNDLADKPTIPSLDGYAKTSEIPSKVSELENDSNYLSSIPEEYVTDTELEAKGYLTEHQDISGKVDKVEGKSLILDTEIARLASVDNYDDTAIKAEIAKKADTTSIPSKVSELTNDSNYQTAEQVNSTVTTEIAKVVADAPEDFDTLKEMSDWIAGHEDDASAMNSAISDNKTAITALQTGKADKSDIPTTVAELTDSANYAKTADVNDSISALQTGKADASDLTAHTDDADIHVTAEEKALVETIEDKVDKTSIATTLSSESTNDEVVGAKLAYDELQKVSSETKEQFATASGESITVNDSVDGKIRDLKLYGKSEQKQYSGKNLLNSTLETTTINGVTCTNNGDGTYTLNGTATDDCNFTLTTETNTEDGKTYKIVGCPSGGSSNTYRLSFWGGSLPEYGSGTIFTNEDLNATYKYLYINIVSGYTCNNLVFKPMITTDLEATYDDFEAYVGGIPSPNPSYPQEIKSVVNPVVKVCGKNLLNSTLETTTVNGVTCTNNGDGTYTFNGTATDIAIFVVTAVTEITEKHLHEHLRLTGCPETGSMDTYRLKFWSNVQEPVYDFGGGSKVYIEKTASDGGIEIIIATGFKANNLVFKPMLTTDLNATYDDFEPYQETIATLPYTLNAIPVKSGGNVTIDGQEYIADYVDIENKKLVRCVGENTNRITIWKNTSGGGLGWYDLEISNTNFLCFLCKQYIKENYTAWDSTVPCFEIKKNIGAIRFYDTQNKNITVELMYDLATPTTIDLTDEEAQAFKELATYYPTTNVFVSSDQLDGYAELKYPTTDVSGLASQNESRIAKLAKDTDDKLSVIGKYKNLLNPILETETHNGVTFTKNDDGTYSLSGSRTDTSSSAYISFIIDYPLEKGRYKLTGALDENNNIRCIIKESGSENKNIYDYGKGVVLDISKPNTTITLMIVSIDDTSQTRIIKPMLTTNLSATYDDFVPYTGDGETLASDVAEIKNDLGGLTFSASGTTLSITDGTNTWTLEANS